MLNILIVDDSPIVCEALQTFINKEKKFEIIGISHDGLTALEQIQNFQQPHVVLMDLDMPKMGGIACTKNICRQFPGTKVIIVSSLDNPQIASCALKNGAKGFLNKDHLTAGKLINAIWSVHNGYFQLEGKIAEQMFAQSFSLPKKAPTPVDCRPKVQEKKQKDWVLQDAWA